MLTREKQYSEKCATFLAQKLLDGATDETTIAMISAPSVFVAMKNILVSEMGPPRGLREALEPRGLPPVQPS